jgi:dTDP-4-amino-4,6-dideoxygalactose transaminase
MLARRREIVKQYDCELHPLGITSMEHFDHGGTSSCHLYLARIPGINESQRNSVIIKMANLGIATNVHYKPPPMFTAYKNLGFCIDDFPNAFSVYENEITLPLHNGLSDEDVDYVVNSLKKLL